MLALWRRLLQDVRDNKAVYLVAAFFSILLFLKIDNNLEFYNARNYYRYLVSLVLDRDLNIMNQFGNLSPFPAANLTLGGYIPDGRPPTGSLVWGPFFVVAVALSRALGYLGMEIPTYVDFPPKSIFDASYGPYIVWLHFGTWVVGISGLIVTYRLCGRFFSKSSSFIALAAMMFSTMFYWTMRVEGVSLEVLSIFMLSLFLYIWLVAKENPHKWVTLGLVGGWMLSMRPFLLPVVFLPLVPLAQSFLKREKSLRGVFFELSLYGVFGVLGVLPLLISWQTIFGSPLANPHGAFPSYAPPLWEFPSSTSFLFRLFGTYMGTGLFTYAPVVLFSLAGFVVFVKRSRTVAILLLLPILYEVLLSTGFALHWNVGLRRHFLYYLPIFAPGLAALLERVGKRVLLPILAVTTLWQWIQFLNHPYTYDFGSYQRLLSLFLSKSYELGQGFLASQQLFYFTPMFILLILTYILQKRGLIDRHYTMLVGAVVALILVNFLDSRASVPNDGPYLIYKILFVLAIFVTVRFTLSMVSSPWSAIKRYIVLAVVAYQVAFVGIFAFAYFQSEVTKAEYARRGLYNPAAFVKTNAELREYTDTAVDVAKYYLGPSLGEYNVERAKDLYLSALVNLPGEPQHMALLEKFAPNDRDDILSKLWDKIQNPDGNLSKFLTDPRRVDNLAHMFTAYGRYDIIPLLWLRSLKADPGQNVTYNRIAYLSGEGFPWEKVSDPGVEAFLVGQDRLLGIVKEAARISELADLRETGRDGGAPNQLASSARRIGEYASGLAYGLEDPYIRRLGQELAESPGLLVGGSSSSAWSKAREKAYQMALLAYSALQKYPYLGEAEWLFFEMSQGQESSSALPNPSFEAWGKWFSIGPLFPEGWNTDVGPVNWVDYERVENPVLAGRYALKIAPREKGRVRLYPTELDKGLLAGKVVTFGMWVYTRSASARLYIDYNDLEEVRFSQPNRSGSEGWQFLVVTSRIPKDVPYVRLVFSLDGSGSEDWAVVDGAQLWVWE